MKSFKVDRSRLRRKVDLYNRYVVTSLTALLIDRTRRLRSMPVATAWLPLRRCRERHRRYSIRRYGGNQQQRQNGCDPSHRVHRMRLNSEMVRGGTQQITTP